MRFFLEWILSQDTVEFPRNNIRERCQQHFTVLGRAPIGFAIKIATVGPSADGQIKINIRWRPSRRIA